jgi:hypothetical protein
VTISGVLVPESIKVDPRGGRLLGWLRNGAVVLLLALATLLAVLSPPVVWGRNLVLDSNRYVSTLSPLASDAGVQRAVINAIDAQFAANIDMKALAQQVLPPAASILAGPIAGGSASLVNSLATKFVQGPAFPKLWVTINRAAHTQVVAILTGKGPGGQAATVVNGRVILDLAPVVVKVKSLLVSAGLTVADGVPVVGASIEIAQIKGIEKARSYTRLFNRIADWLPWAALLLFAGAITLARRRRRTLVISAGCVAGAMLALGLLLNVFRSIYLKSITAYVDAPTGGRIYDIFVRFLRDGIRSVLIVAVLVLIIGWLCGPVGSAKRIRGSAMSVLRRSSYQFREGGVATFVTTYRSILDVGVLVLGALILVLLTNPSTAIVITVVAIVVIVLAFVELTYRQSGRTPTSVDV